MPVIDQAVTWAKVEQRLATETDPVLRRNLGTVLAHMRAEAEGDLDGLLATLSDGVAYHAYSVPGVPEANPVGKAGVRKFYERSCVLTEGVMRMAYPGRTLQARGIAVDDPDAAYLYETRMAVLWPLDEHGLVLGEDTYTSGDGFEGIAGRKLRPEDVVGLVDA